MAREKITDVVERELAQFLPEHGYELYLTEYSKEGKDWYLKVFVDKPEGGITVDDCEVVSRWLSDRLDEKNRRELFKDDPTVNIAALRARKLRNDLESMVDSGTTIVEPAPFRGKHLIPERKKDIEKMREAIKVLAASQDVRITYLPAAEKEYKTARAALAYRFSAFFVEDTMEALKTLISLSESVNFRVENTPDNGRDIVISFDTGKIWEEA